MEKQKSQQLFLDLSIGIKPVNRDLGELSNIDRLTLYSFTLYKDRTLDGVIGNELDHVKDLIMKLVSGETDDWQSLFERSYGIGFKIDKWGLRPDDLKRFEQICKDIYNSELQDLERVTPEGKYYLPEETVGRFLQKDSLDPLSLAQTIYLAGFSAGVLYRDGNKKEVETNISDGSTIELAGFDEFINLPEYKRQLIMEIRVRAKDFVNRVFFQGKEKIDSLSDLTESEQKSAERFNQLIPEFEGRIYKMIGKKKSRVVNCGGLVSEWYKEYFGYIEQAERLSAESNKDNIKRVAGRLRRLALKKEVLERDSASGKLQTNIDALMNKFLVGIADKSDIKSYSSKEVYELFINFLEVQTNLEKEKIYTKQTIPKELRNVIFSDEEQITILNAISPFNESYCRELGNEGRKDIFYRWLKALSVLADMNQTGGGNKLLNYFREGTRLDINVLQREISALIEYGVRFDDLNYDKQEVAGRSEVLDEICHYIRVVTGLKFESRIERPEDLRLSNINRQFVKMANVLLNKKISRGEISIDDVYPVKPGMQYADKNMRVSNQTVCDERKQGYPYLQTSLKIENIDENELRRISVLLNNLLLKYPFEVAIPTFLFTLYDCYGDLDIDGAISQLFAKSDQTKELKSCIIGKSLSFQTDKVVNFDNDLEIVELTNWEAAILRKKVRPLVVQLLSQSDSSRKSTFDIEFFHTHADETKTGKIQQTSGFIAQALKEELDLIDSSSIIIGRPVIDNAHVVDRLNYDLVKREAAKYGVEIPEVVFEGSPLQQWIGDQLFKLIPFSQIVKRGDSLYFKVNDYIEVELYTNISGNNVTQACVLNHIANDIYKLNPQGWNSLFRNYISSVFPDIYAMWQNSGAESFEEFYYQVTNNQQTSELRDQLKESLFRPITSRFLSYLKTLSSSENMAQEAKTILREVLKDDQPEVIPVQILDGFFKEQGDKYRALFKVLRQQFVPLEQVNIYRLAYDLYTGEIELVSLSS